MRRRQTVPVQWLIVTEAAALQTVGRLPRGSGVLVVHPLAPAEMCQLRVAARRRDLTIVPEEFGAAMRVHNLRELRRALLARTPIILLSPLYPTRTHPDWTPIPRMRAAAMARLAKRRLTALGGMDARKFERVRHLGFQSWAGISAFRT